MEEIEDNGQSTPTQTGRQRGCMFCRIEVDVTDVSMLKEGDHIVSRGQMACLGYCYDHHAIVKTITRVTNGQHIDQIVVLGVHRKGGLEETYQRGEQRQGTCESHGITPIDGQTEEGGCASIRTAHIDGQTEEEINQCRGNTQIDVQTAEGTGHSSVSNVNDEQTEEKTCDSSGANNNGKHTDAVPIEPRTSNGNSIGGKCAGILTFVVRYLCCCFSCITAERGYKIEPTTLLIKTDDRYGILGEYRNSAPQRIKKIVYNKPRNDHETVVEIASRLEEETNVGPGIEEYNLLLLNCEHFTNACVNGQEDMSLQEIKIQSSSLQSQFCWWRILHVLFWSVQAFFYFVNFNVFAAFISKDDNLDLMHLMNSSFLENICVNHNNSLPGFNTHCDWFVVILLVIALVLVSLLTSWTYYHPLYKYGFICSKCLGISRVDYLSRLFTTIFIEVIAIYLENPIYRFSSGLNAGMTRTYLIVACVSITAAYVVYSLSNLLTFLLGIYCYPTLNRPCELSQYFPFRGVPWLCISFVKILKHICRRNVYFRKKNSISPNTSIDFIGSVNETE